MMSKRQELENQLRYKILLYVLCSIYIYLDERYKNRKSMLPKD